LFKFSNPKFAILELVPFYPAILKRTEQRDIHKYSIYNLQFSIPAHPGYAYYYIDNFLTNQLINHIMKN